MPRSVTIVLLLGLVLGCAAMPGSADLNAQEAPQSRLKGQIVIVAGSGAVALPKTFTEDLKAHVEAVVPGAGPPNILKGAEGRLILELSFPSASRTVFEKMVAELPTAPFSVPVRVESWNIKAVALSVVGSSPSEPPPPELDVVIGGKSDVIESLQFREVQLRDALAYLAQHVEFQYICPGDLGEASITAQLRRVSLDEFLEGVALGLDIPLRKVGTFYVFVSPRGLRQQSSREGNGGNGTHKRGGKR